MNAVEFIAGMATTTNIKPMQIQLDYSQSIEEALALKKDLTIEKDGGNGKTIGFSVPALFHSLNCNKPVIIATSTASNRTAILEDIYKIKSHAKAIGSPIADIPVVDYKSARDYCSLHRIDTLIRRLRASKAPNSVIAQVVSIYDVVAKSSEPVLTEDVLPTAIIEGDLAVVTRDDIGISPGEHSVDILETLRQELRQNLEGPALILMTMGMLSKQRKIREKTRNNEIGAVILDEVDKMISLSFITDDNCDLDEVSQAINVLDQKYNLDVSRAHYELDQLHNAIKTIRPHNAKQIMLTRSNLPQTLCDAIIVHLQNLVTDFNNLLIQFSYLDSIADTFSEEVEERTYTYKLDDILGSMMNFIDNFTPPIGSDAYRLKTDTDIRLFIRWQTNHVSLHVVSANPGRAIKWLFASKVPIIMTTAMLASSVKQFNSQIGARHETSSKEFRVAKFGNLNFKYYKNMPVPVVDKKVSKIYLDAVAHEIRNHYETGQYMLVLCASYNDVQHFKDKLNDLPLIVQTRGTKMRELINRFVNMNGGIFLSVSWEGYNIVARDGSRRGLLNSVVISRIPFVAPEILVHETLESIYGKDRSRTWIWEHNRAEVIRRIHQGICRLIRGPNDKGDVLLLDPRFPPNEAIRRLDPMLAPNPGHAPILNAIPHRFRNRDRNYELRTHD